MSAWRLVGPEIVLGSTRIAVLDDAQIVGACGDYIVEACNAYDGLRASLARSQDLTEAAVIERDKYADAYKDTRSIADEATEEAKTLRADNKRLEREVARLTKALRDAAEQVKR